MDIEQSTDSQKNTMAALAAEMGIRADELSKKLRPVREHLGVKSLVVRIGQGSGSRCVINPEYDGLIRQYLKTGKLSGNQSEAGALAVTPCEVQVLGKGSTDWISGALAKLQPESQATQMAELNGRQDSNNQQLREAFAIVVAAENAVKERGLALIQRYEDTQKHKEVLTAMRSKLGEAWRQNQKLVQVAELVDRTEQEIAQGIADLNLQQVASLDLSAHAEKEESELDAAIAALKSSLSD